MLVDLDKDEVNTVNYQESVPKMPMTVCEDFKKRCCELMCVCARTPACMCICVCMYVCVWYVLHVCCVCVLCV